MRAIRRRVLFLLPAISPVLLGCRFRDLFRVPPDKHIGPRWLGQADFHETFSLSKFVCVILFCAATAIASPAQTLTTLVNFDQTNGASPERPSSKATTGTSTGQPSAVGSMASVRPSR
jgi:hypothetical protein